MAVAVTLSDEAVGISTLQDEAVGITSIVESLPDLRLLSGLYAYWTMDEASGTRRNILDATGASDLFIPRSGIVGYEAGKVNNSAHLSTNVYSMLGSLLPDDFPIGNGSWTISFWVCPASVSFVPILNDIIDFGIWDTNPPRYYDLNSSLNNLGTPVIGTWVHVLATYDSTLDLYNIYINGVAKHGTGIDPGANYDWSTWKYKYLLIGASPDYKFHGSVDEFGIWNRVLSSDEISLVYNSGNGLALCGTYPARTDETQANAVAVSSSDIKTIIELLSPGDTYEVPDGLYGLAHTLDHDLYIPSGVTVKAAAGARPVFTRTDGYTPRIHIGDNATIDGLWFGGKMSADGYEHVQSGNGNTIKKCTFWGYYECVEEGTTKTTPNTWSGNRFVCCGHDTQSHTLYITTQPSGANDTIDHNILIGSNDGYQLHFWHEPTNLTITNNFIADNNYAGIAISGTGHNFSKNIIWNHIYGKCYITLIDTTSDNMPFTKNLWYGIWRLSGVTSTSTGWANNYVANSPDFTYAPGSDTLWSIAELETAVNIDVSDVNSAIDNLRRAFNGTPQEIHDNDDIEGWFDVIEDVMEKWDTYTA